MPPRRTSLQRHPTAATHVTRWRYVGVQRRSLQTGEGRRKVSGSLFESGKRVRSRYLPVQHVSEVVAADHLACRDTIRSHRIPSFPLLPSVPILFLNRRQQRKRRNTEEAGRLRLWADRQNSPDLLTILGCCCYTLHAQVLSERSYREIRLETKGCDRDFWLRSIGTVSMIALT